MMARGTRLSGGHGHWVISLVRASFLALEVHQMHCLGLCCLRQSNWNTVFDGCLLSFSSTSANTFVPLSTQPSPLGITDYCQRPAYTPSQTAHIKLLPSASAVHHTGSPS